jgi:hypothetical protein
MNDNPGTTMQDRDEQITNQTETIIELYEKVNTLEERMQEMYQALVASGSSVRIAKLHEWFDKNGRPL